MSMLLSVNYRYHRRETLDPVNVKIVKVMGGVERSRDLVADQLKTTGAITTGAGHQNPKCGRDRCKAPQQRVRTNALRCHAAKGAGVHVNEVGFQGRSISCSARPYLGAWLPFYCIEHGIPHGALANLARTGMQAIGVAEQRSKAAVNRQYFASKRKPESK